MEKKQIKKKTDRKDRIDRTKTIN